MHIINSRIFFKVSLLIFTVTARKNISDILIAFYASHYNALDDKQSIIRSIKV